MTRGQRRTHVGIWIALALVLPVLVVAGLWARRSPDVDTTRAPDSGSTP
jgi:hypothetical protein